MTLGSVLLYLLRELSTSLNKPTVVNRQQIRRNLDESAASFIGVYDSYEDRMRQIVGELQDVDTEVKKIQMSLLAGKAGLAGGAVVAMLTARLTEGLSLIIFILLALIVLCFLLKQKIAEINSVRRVSRLVKEFRTMIAPMNSTLEDVKSACGHLRRTSVGAEALKFIRLEIDILQLWAFSEKLQTPATLNQIRKLSQDYEETVSKLYWLKIKMQLPEEN